MTARNKSGRGIRLYKNNLLEKLAQWCFRGVIMRVAGHYEERCDTMEKYLAAFKIGMAENVSDYQQKIEELNIKISKLCAQIEQKTQQLTEQSERHQNLGLEHEQLQKRLRQQNARAEDLQVRSTGLQNEQQRKGERLQQLQALVVELGQNMQLKQAELTQKTFKIKSLMTIIGSLSRERSEAVAELERLRGARDEEVSLLKIQLYQKELHLQECLMNLKEYQEKQPFAMGAGPSSATVVVIPREMLRRLIQLCHPDKHSGSRAALEASQWLNQQKKTKTMH